MEATAKAITGVRIAICGRGLRQARSGPGSGSLSQPDVRIIAPLLRERSRILFRGLWQRGWLSVGPILWLSKPAPAVRPTLDAGGGAGQPDGYTLPVAPATSLEDLRCFGWAAWRSTVLPSCRRPRPLPYP
jgi:hypothetical protein